MTAPGNISNSEPPYKLHCGGREENEYPAKAMRTRKIGTAKRTVDPKRPMTEVGTGFDILGTAVVQK